MRETGKAALFIRIVPLVCSLLLFIGLTGWGAWKDVTEVEHSMLASEASRLTTHAARTVARIESVLESYPQELPFSNLPELGWLREHWRNAGERTPPLIAALIDPYGKVVRHSRPRLEGRILEQRWYERIIPLDDLQIVVITSRCFNDAKRCYGVQQPIVCRGDTVGFCHVAMDAETLDQAIDHKQGRLIQKWIIIAAVILLMMFAACISIIQMVKESISLKQAIAMQHVQQLTELGRLAGGLAHEIRNPLNAIRLNLFTLGKKLEDTADPQVAEASSEILRETDLEIERLEGLIRSVLGYARPSKAKGEKTDAVHEVQSTVHFVQGMTEKEGITLTKVLPRKAVMVHIDQDRLRQMLLNVINNAREVSRNGTIRIAVRERKGWADIAVSDSGPGVPEQDLDKIFEPFYTTKESGTGLGLALVRRFAQEAGGSVSCQVGNGAGTTLTITLPLCKSRG